MKLALLEVIRCSCGGPLLIAAGEPVEGELRDGELACEACGARHPVRRYVPRLVPVSNYSASWGELWRETGELLRDSFTGETFHEDALHGSYAPNAGLDDRSSPFGFSWPRRLDGIPVLEVGPGTGNFTEHLVETGAELVCVDMSDAIDTLPEELLLRPNVNVVQADINDPVIEPGWAERIWLFQVLQHTPSPPQTLARLRELLAPDGLISFTSYGGESFRPWYYPLTRRIPDRLAWHLLRFTVPVIVPLKARILRRRIPLLSRLVGFVLQPFDPRNIYLQTLEGNADGYVHGRLWQRHRDRRMLLRYVLVNTFDCITPRYTNTGTHQGIEDWARGAGYARVETWGEAGVRANAWR